MNDENTVVSTKDLFGNFVLPPQKKGQSERGNLLSFFKKQGFIDQKGKILEYRNLAVLLSHFTVSQLYALKSAYEDRLTRNGKDGAWKYWWFVIRTKESPV